MCAASGFSVVIIRNAMLKKYFLYSWLLLALSAWMFCYKLGEPHFYHTRNESRRARIAQEMLDTGNFLIPQLEGSVILTKPPLFYWAVAFCSPDKLVTEYTARLPSAVSAVGSILLTFFLGCYLFDVRVGFCSALCLMVTNICVAQARYAEMESMLTFFIVGAVYCFFRGCRERRRARALVWFVLFFAALGLGTLTKGPFAFTFPLIPILGYVLIYRDQPVFSRKSFLMAIPIYLAILLPWLILISKQYPRFGLIVLWETIGRVALGYTHQEPFYFYFEKIGDTLFPWIFFLPFAIWMGATARLRQWRREYVFLLLWFFGNLLFLSLSKSKRDFYLTPIAPGVALLIGFSWQDLWNWLGEKTASYAPSATTGVLLTGAGIMLAACAAGNPFDVNFPGMKFPKVPAFLMFVGLCLVGGALLKKCLPKLSAASAALYAMVAATMLFQYAYLTYTVPIKNQSEAAKYFYIHVSNIVSPAEELAYFGENENYTFSFYARRAIHTIKTASAMYAYMAAPEKKYLVVTEKFYRKYALPSWTVRATAATSEHHSWGGYFLVSNK